jgi:hypothetical protein
MRNLAHAARPFRAAVLTVLVAATLVAACEDLRDKPSGVDPARADAGADGGDVRPAGPDVPQTMPGIRRRPRRTGGAPSGTRAMRPPQPPPCTPGQTRCAELGATVQVCTIDMQWTDKEKCTSVCSAGVCRGLCTPGEKHCGADQDARGPVARAENGDRRAPAGCQFRVPGPGHLRGRVPARQPAMCRGGRTDARDLRREGGAGCPEHRAPTCCSSGSCGGSCRPGAQRCGGRTPRDLQPGGHLGAGAALRLRLLGRRRVHRRVPAGQQALQRQRRTDAADLRRRRHVAIVGGVREPVRRRASAGARAAPARIRCAAGGRVEACSASGAWLASRTCDFICSGAGVCFGRVACPRPAAVNGTTEELCSGQRQLAAHRDRGLSQAERRKAAAGDGDCDSGTCAELTGGAGDLLRGRLHRVVRMCRNGATGMPNGTVRTRAETTPTPTANAAPRAAAPAAGTACATATGGVRLHPTGTMCEEARCATNRRSRLSARTLRRSGHLRRPDQHRLLLPPAVRGLGPEHPMRVHLRRGGGSLLPGRRPATGRRTGASCTAFANPNNGRHRLRALRAHRRALLAGGSMCDPGVRCLLDTQIPSCVECGKSASPAAPVPA